MSSMKLNIAENHIYRKKEEGKKKFNEFWEIESENWKGGENGS